MHRLSDDVVQKTGESERNDPISGRCSSLDANPRTALDTLCELRDELTTVRAIARLLLKRLDREPDGYGREKEACEVIIVQTRLIEQALERISGDVAQPQAWFVDNRGFATFREDVCHEA